MKNHPVNNDYVQNLVEGLVSEEAVRLDKKVKGEKPFQSRNPKTNRLESEISNNDDYTVPSKIERDGSVKKGSTEQNATQSNEDWLTDNDEPKRKDRNDGARLKRKLARKVKPAPVAAAQMESKQTVYQSADKPENNSYLDKDVKLDPFPVKKLKKKDKKKED